VPFPTPPRGLDGPSAIEYHRSVVTQASPQSQISKTERILNLVSYLLKENRPVPWREIAGKVVGYDDESDPKSLERRFERDKAALKEMGIPIAYYPAGAHETEGYFIPREACFLDRLELLPHEAALLNLVTELALRKGGSGFSADLMSALQKLRFDEDPALAPPPAPLSAPPPQKKRGRPPKRRPAAGDPSAQGGGETGGRMLFDLDLMASARGDPNLEPLAEAVLANRRVAFTYYAIGPDETRRREVDPYGLGFARGAWYVVGFDQLRRGIRCFRLDRIKGSVEPIGPERAFKPPVGFRVQDHLEKQPWEMAAAEPIEVVLHVDAHVAWFVEDLVAGKRPVEHRPDGSAIVRLEVRDVPSLLKWVLRHGRHARIVEPARLRADLLAMIAELEARHERPEA
jgi:proteasome accessory factor B